MHSLATWFTMTVSLFCAVLYSTLYLLEKFTSLNIFEDDVTFEKSPNAILKIAPISNEATFKANKDEIVVRSLEQSAEENKRNVDEISNTNAMLLLSEVVEEVSKASRVRKQKEFDEL